MSHSDPLNAQRWLSFLNQSGETIPPYGVIQMKSDTGTVETIHGYKRRLVAIKPNDLCGDANTTIAFNSGTPCPDGKYGNCAYGIDAPTWARIEYNSGEAQGLTLTDNNIEWLTKEFGPIDGQWRIDSGGTGYLLQSAPDTSLTSLGRVLVRKKGGGNGLLLMTSAETTKVCGPNGDIGAGVTSGVYRQGEAYIVPTGVDDSPITGTIDFDAKYVVDFSEIGSLVFPNFEAANGVKLPYTFWATSRSSHPSVDVNDPDSTYFAVAGGATSFRGIIASVVSGTTYMVTPTFVGGTPNDILCTTLFGEILIVEQEVAVTMMEGVNPIIAWAGCPPETV